MNIGDITNSLNNTKQYISVDRDSFSKIKNPMSVTRYSSQMRTILPNQKSQRMINEALDRSVGQTESLFKNIQSSKVLCKVVISPKKTIDHRDQANGSPYLQRKFKILDEDIDDSDCYSNDSFPNMNSPKHSKQKAANTNKLTEFS